ncbi:hypothetical protein Tco_0989371 [Tanacetum coccineum]|uniref:Uncharacterized protein n=1 Tax=Tanacetum coccineum TaxID=301880 RepID=A0ABQ5ETS9_9ASTR
MTIRQFILAVGLYTEEEMNNNLFEFFCDTCIRNMPNNYNLTIYYIDITTRNHYDSRHPPSYTTIKNPIHRLVYRFLALSIAGRHNAKEKVTLEDLFFVHNMDGGALVDVPWNIAKFLFDKAKGAKKKSMIVGAHLIGMIARYYGLMTNAYLRRVTLGQGTTLLNIVKLVELGICRYNGLGLGELVDDMLDNSKDEVTAAEAKRAQDEADGVRRCPNMSFTNRLRAMDKRLGDIDSNIYKLSDEVEKLTAVISIMSEQYDQFYEEFNAMRLEQHRFHTWETDHLSQLLSYHHIDHTRYDGARYSYVPDILDLGVQQGVNFIASPQDFSTALTASTDLFGVIGTPGAGPSTSHNFGNAMDEE